MILQTSIFHIFPRCKGGFLGPSFFNHAKACIPARQVDLMEQLPYEGGRPLTTQEWILKHSKTDVSLHAKEPFRAKFKARRYELRAS